ncbi:MAG TPA: hypothetical protein VIB07_07110 [Nitrososphaera sp.]|jgi:hypothetical protein
MSAALGSELAARIAGSLEIAALDVRSPHGLVVHLAQKGVRKSLHGLGGGIRTIVNLEPDMGAALLAAEAHRLIAFRIHGITTHDTSLH